MSKLNIDNARLGIRADPSHRAVAGGDYQSSRELSPTERPACAQRARHSGRRWKNPSLNNAAGLAHRSYQRRSLLGQGSHGPFHIDISNDHAIDILAAQQLAIVGTRGERVTLFDSPPSIELQPSPLAGEGGRGTRAGEGLDTSGGKGRIRQRNCEKQYSEHRQAAGLAVFSMAKAAN